MNSLDFLIPWRSSTIPDGALRITKQERDREEEAIAFLREAVRRLKTGQAYWNPVERDKAQEAIKILGLKCPIGDQMVAEIVKEMQLHKPDKIAFEGAYQTIHTSAYQTISKQYQGLLDLVESHDSDEKKRQVLYTAFQEDPIAILVCISNPIERANTPGYSKTKAYQLMEYVLENKEGWEKVIKIILELHKIIGHENVEKLLLPLIEKALSFNFSSAMKKALEEAPEDFGEFLTFQYDKYCTVGWLGYKYTEYKKFIRKLMLTNADSPAADQTELIQLIQLPKVTSKLLEKESLVKYYLLEESRRINNFENIKIFIESNRLPSEKLDQLEILHYAARAGNLPLVKYLIKKGVDTNYFTQSSKMTALYHATLQGHFEVARYLILNNAKINSLKADRPPLHVAINKRRTEILKLLLENGADPNIWWDKKPAIYRAITLQYLEGFQLLIKANANVDVNFSPVEEIDTTSKEKKHQYYSPLENALNVLASRNQDQDLNLLKITESLIQSGASIFLNSKNLLKTGLLFQYNRRLPEIKNFHDKLYTTFINILKRTSPSFEKDLHSLAEHLNTVKKQPNTTEKQLSAAEEKLYNFVACMLRITRQTYIWKKHLQFIHGIDRKWLPNSDNEEAKNLCIVIAHLMFLQYDLHPLKYDTWPKQLRDHIKAPQRFKDDIAFYEWAGLFINTLAQQKGFKFRWESLLIFAKFSPAAIELCFLPLWKDLVTSEIAKTLPQKLHSYIKDNSYGFFIKSRITLIEESDELDRWCKDNLQPAHKKSL